MMKAIIRLFSGLLLIPFFSALSAEEVRLGLEYSEDLSQWSAVELTPEMFGPDGMLNMGPAARAGFFRMRIDFQETPANFMVPVHGGMLSTSNDDLNGVVVDTFYMGKYQVTWGEWQAVRAQAVSRGYDIGDVGDGCAEDHPVHSVNWFDVVKWCNLKSELEGLAPVYAFGGDVYKTGLPDHTAISQNLSANGYRLPMEAEWEFAARGGNETNNYIYAGSNDLNEVGWYWDNSDGAACDMSSDRGTWPVGQKAANELGLHDMSGNLSEWCWDEAVSPLGSTVRRNRGGSWGLSAHHSAVSSRSLDVPINRAFTYGFRLARNASQQ